MSNNAINEAKAEFEAIKNFATEEAIKELQKRVKPKLDEMLEKTLDESISIQSDNSSIKIDDEQVITVQNGDTQVIVSPQAEPETIEQPEIMSDSDETEIEMEEGSDIVYEISSINEEEIIPQEAPNPFQMILDRLASIESKIGTIPEKTVVATEEAPISSEEIIDDETVAPEEEEEDVVIIDDEEVNTTPTATVTTTIKAPVEPVPVIQEFDLKEFEDEDDELMAELFQKLEDAGFELIDDEVESDDVSKSISVSMSDDEEDVELDIEIDDDGDCVCQVDSSSYEGELDEMTGHGTSILVKNSNKRNREGLATEDKEEGDVIETLEEAKGSALPFKHNANRRNRVDRDRANTESLSDETVDLLISDTDTALEESKLDELIKENESLKKDIREFEESFVELRNSIDEMQTFNAKLALANKLFLNGGLSTDDKMKINEALDQANTVKEAEKVYLKIIKENKVTTTVSNTTKATASAVSSTNQPIYESKEAKMLKSEFSRSQVLAGISKRDE